MLNSKFYNQVDECSMEGPLSLIFSDIYIIKTKRKVVKPTKPKICWWYYQKNIKKHR